MGYDEDESDSSQIRFIEILFFGATATSHITSKRVDIQIPSFRISYTYSIFSNSYEMK